MYATTTTTTHQRAHAQQQQQQKHMYPTTTTTTIKKAIPTPRTIIGHSPHPPTCLWVGWVFLYFYV